VVFTPEARNDLFEIYDWIAKKAGPQIAISYMERIETFVWDLNWPRNVGTGARRVSIAFGVDNEHVSILRLFHGGQNWEDKLV